jgi:hypothetical protein
MMHRRLFLAAMGGAVVACQPDEHRDLKTLYEHYKLVWNKSRTDEWNGCDGRMLSPFG